MHTTIYHMIKILEWSWNLKQIPIAYSACVCILILKSRETDCSVQLGLETLKWLYTSMFYQPTHPSGQVPHMLKRYSTYMSVVAISMCHSSVYIRKPLSQMFTYHNFQMYLTKIDSSKKLVQKLYIMLESMGKMKTRQDLLWPSDGSVVHCLAMGWASIITGGGWGTGAVEWDVHERVNYWIKWIR